MSAVPAATATAVLHRRRGAGLWLTLNRPDALNGISPDLLTGLHGGLDVAEADRDIRAVVVAAQGRAFCAGADLSHIESLTREGRSMQPFLADIGRLFDRLEATPLPVIGAVQGLAAGGGLELLLCCDLVYASEDARIGDAHANYGLLPGGGASARLPRLLGAQRAKGLLFGGELLAARELFALGLFNGVLEAERVEAKIDEVVDGLAAKSPLGLARMKALVADAVDAPLATALRAERTMGALHARSEDQAEGIAAFHAKRRPVFTGR